MTFCKLRTLARRTAQQAGQTAIAASLALGVGGFAAVCMPHTAAAEAYKDFVLPKLNGKDTSFERVKKDGLTVATGNDWPFSFVDDKTGEWKGIDADIINYATKMLGIEKIKLETVGWDGLVPGVASGRFDMIGDSINYTAERAKVVSFSFPTYYYAETLVVAQGNPLKLHSIDDLKGHTVGTLLGSNYAEHLKDIPGITVQTYQDWQQLLPQLAIGRIDAAMYDQPVMAATLGDHPEMKLEMVEDYQPAAEKNPTNYSRYVFRQGDVALMSAFDTAIQWMEYNGKMQEILKKWNMTAYNN
ncbi:MAG TPA: transporter substrate-binding domain-containing protein [Paenirhodobacter sp.]